MPAKPYIGISGVTNIQDAKQLESIFIANGLSSSEKYAGVIGYLLDEDGLNGGLNDRRHVSLKDINGLLRATPNAMATIHYSARDSGLASHTSRIFENEGIYDNNLCRSVQFNMHWPEISQIETIMAKYPEMKIVLSVTQKSIKELSPHEIAGKLAQYDGLIAYALIDPSWGQGRELDTGVCLEIYDKIVSMNPELMIGFAGGLGPENVKRVLGRLRESIDNTFCIDAESALRDKRSERRWDDDLNLEKASLYVSAASEVLL